MKRLFRTLHIWKQEIFMALLAGFSVVLVGLLIQSSLAIHLDELEYSLKEVEAEEQGLSQAHLIMKYVNHYKLYQGKTTLAEKDLEEFQIQTLLEDQNDKSKRGVQTDNFIDRISVSIINFFRQIRQKSALPDAEQSKSSEFLDAAWYLERNKHYHKAIELYDKALKEADISEATRGSIWLHQGFCHAVLGQDSIAEHKYNKVIEEHEDKQIARTAETLLSYLKQFSIEKEKVAKQEDNYAKAEKLTKLLKCDEAMATFSRLKNLTPKQKSQMEYYKGMCLEETGNKAKAAKAYISAISSGGVSDLSRDANRRLFAVSRTMAQGQEIATQSKKLGKALKDRTLERMLASVPKKEDQTASEEQQQRDPSPKPLLSSASQEMAEDFAEIMPDEKELQQLTQTMERVKENVEHTVRQERLKRIEEARQRELNIPRRLSPIRIRDKDGKVFYGQLLTEPDAPVLKVKTMIGVIGISNANVRELGVDR